jgi:hypothetical protein
MIKTTARYQLSVYKTLELIIKSEPIFNSDYYDPTSISGSNNSVMTEERTHSQAREQWPFCVPVQNMDVDVNVDDDEEEEEWHLDVDDDDIQDITYIHIDEIKDVIDV